MKDYDERAWELEVAMCDDGDILIQQGDCPECREGVLVRLHRTHFPMVADLMGYVPASEVERACERLRDRLALLVAMVKAHTRDGDPLRAAVACLLDGSPTVQEPFEGPSEPLPSPLEGPSSRPSGPAPAPATDDSQLTLLVEADQ